MTLLNGPARLAIDPCHAGTFSSAPCSVTLSGPLKLFRFLGTFVDATSRKKRRNPPFGAFWFGRTVYDVLREEFQEAALSGERIKTPAQTILRGVREGLAVTYEWNTFDSLAEMTISSGDTVAAWTGLAAWQLEWLSQPRGRTLEGGFVQDVVYDVARMPAGIVRQYPIQSLWREFSRALP